MSCCTDCDYLTSEENDYGEQWCGKRGSWHKPSESACSDFSSPDCPNDRDTFNRCCADCDYMDTSNRNNYGECWCERMGNWYQSGDKACGYFR